MIINTKSEDKMPRKKITKNFMHALRLAVNKAGSQVEFERLSGVSQKNLSKYLSGKADFITDGICEKLLPFLAESLSKEELTQFSTQFTVHQPSNIQQNNYATLLNDPEIPDEFKRSIKYFSKLTSHEQRSIAKKIMNEALLKMIDET